MSGKTEHLLHGMFQKGYSIETTQVSLTKQPHRKASTTHTKANRERQTEMERERERSELTHLSGLVHVTRSSSAVDAPRRARRYWRGTWSSRSECPRCRSDRAQSHLVCALFFPQSVRLAAGGATVSTLEKWHSLLIKYFGGPPGPGITSPPTPAPRAYFTLSSNMRPVLNLFFLFGSSVG